MIKIGEETRFNPEFSGPISDYLIYLYEQSSNNPLPSQIKIPHEAWKPFLELLYKGNNQESPEFIIESSLIPEFKDISSDPNKVILALSGGKDSTANLARLTDEGKDVTAYFLIKANASYGLEEDAATLIASKFNTPIVKDYLQRSGKTDYFENPMKNPLIMARMLEFGLKNNCTTISLGEFWGTDSSTSDFKYDFCDSIDYLMLLEKALQHHIPEFRFDFFWEEEATGISYLITKHPDIIPNLVSCLMPTRYLKQQLKYVEKYHLHADPTRPDEEAIMPGRCMSCWKCMVEWLYLYLWKKVPYNKEYFVNKVIPTLTKHLSEINMQHFKRVQNGEPVSNKLLLDAALDLEYLMKYINDPTTIENDIRHNEHK